MSSVTWDELKQWCLDHGAKNEKITQVRIGPFSSVPVVEIEGLETNEAGRPYVAGVESREPAKWKVSNPLLRLP